MLLLWIDDDYCYTLLDIMYFLENINVPLAEYRRKLVAESKRGITAVTEPDRPFLQQYINGEIETCSQIDLSQIQSLAPLSQIQSSDNATQSKPSKSKEERSKQKHEGYVHAI